MIDRETELFLEPFRNAEEGLEYQPLAEARAGYRELFSAAAVAAPPVQRSDLPCPLSHRSVPCRLYQPLSTARAPRTLLVFMHGGGGVLGDVESYDALMAWLCHHGDQVVLFPEYCLAPEHPFPAGIRECHGVVNWAASMADSWGATPERLTLAGDSTGGSICNACALLAQGDNAASVAAQCLLYPQLDLRREHTYPSRAEFADGRYFLGESGIAWSREHYLTTDADAFNALATALRAPNLASMVPTLILTAELDPLRDEGAAYGAALAKAGVPGLYHCAPGAIHGFVSFAGMLPTGKQALKWLTTHLESLLAGHTDWSSLP